MLSVFHQVAISPTSFSAPELEFRLCTGKVDLGKYPLLAFRDTRLNDLEPGFGVYAVSEIDGVTNSWWGLGKFLKQFWPGVFY